MAMTTEQAREAQKKATEARVRNARKRNELKALIANSSVTELMETYALDVNLSNEQRAEIAKHVITSLVCVEHEQKLKHKLAMERMLLRSELTQAEAEHKHSLGSELEDNKHVDGEVYGF